MYNTIMAAPRVDPCKACAAPALCAVIGNACQEKQTYLASIGINPALDELAREDERAPPRDGVTP